MPTGCTSSTGSKKRIKWKIAEKREIQFRFITGVRRHGEHFAYHDTHLRRIPVSYDWVSTTFGRCEHSINLHILCTGIAVMSRRGTKYPIFFCQASYKNIQLGFFNGFCLLSKVIQMGKSMKIYASIHEFWKAVIFQWKLYTENI